MTLLDILIKGGWVMIPIGIASVMVVAIGVNRYLAITRERKLLDGFVKVWEHRAVDPSGYRSATVTGPGAVKGMLDLYAIDRGGAEVRESEVELVASAELHQLEAGLGTMATLAAVAPLLGFLGTVTGMVRAFMQIQNLGGAVNASVLAGGIWEALITTVAGLVVGIPALLVYNYLANLIQSTARLLEQCGMITIRQMQSR